MRACSSRRRRFESRTSALSKAAWTRRPSSVATLATSARRSASTRSGSGRPRSVSAAQSEADCRIEPVAARSVRDALCGKKIWLSAVAQAMPTTISELRSSAAWKMRSGASTVGNAMIATV